MLTQKELDMQVGRNEPCLCGSGKKYKKCCLTGDTNEDSTKIKKAEQDLWKRVKDQNSDLVEDITHSEKTGLVKMSEIILDYASDLLDMTKTFKEQEKALSLAIMLWNVSLMGENGRESALRNFFNFFPEEAPPEMIEFFQLLIDRKKIEYPLINRFIIDFEITQTRQGLHLNVVSADYLIPSEKNPRTMINHLPERTVL